MSKTRSSLGRVREMLGELDDVINTCMRYQMALMDIAIVASGQRTPYNPLDWCKRYARAVLRGECRCGRIAA